VHAESATGICGLLPYPCGLMSSWAFVLGDYVLGDFVLGAFVRIPSVSAVFERARSFLTAHHDQHIKGPFSAESVLNVLSKALSTLSQKSATVAENGETTATVAEFGDSTSHFSATVAVFGDKLSYSRQGKFATIVASVDRL